MARIKRDKFSNEVLQSHKELLLRIVGAIDDVIDEGLYFAEACRNHKIHYISARRLMDLQIFKNIDITDKLMSSELVEIDAKLLKKDPYISLYQDVLELSDEEISIMKFPLDIEETIDYILDSLPDKTRFVIKEIHGFNDECESKTLLQLSEEMGITKEGVRLINKKGLMSIRRNWMLYMRKGKKEAEREIERQEQYAKEAYEIKKQQDEESLNLLRKELSNVTSDNIKSIPIGSLNLSVRSYNALKNAKIDTIGQLLELKREDLYNIRNIGSKSIEEILSVLNRYNQ